MKQSAISVDAAVVDGYPNPNLTTMAKSKTVNTEVGSKLKSTIKGAAEPQKHGVANSDAFSNAVGKIDQYLEAKGQKVPYEFAMKALYEFLSMDEVILFANMYSDFIYDIRTVLMYPEVSKRFYENSQFTPKGLSSFLKGLETFFEVLQRKEVQADIEKFGLQHYAKRYADDQEWGGVEEAAKPYILP